MSSHVEGIRMPGSLARMWFHSYQWLKVTIVASFWDIVLARTEGPTDNAAALGVQYWCDSKRLTDRPIIHPFYRAMHFSAKRALARSCDCMSSVCLSVRPSVCDVGGLWSHIGWKSWKQIAPTISPTPSLFAAKRQSTYSQENMGKFWRD